MVNRGELAAQAFEEVIQSKINQLKEDYIKAQVNSLDNSEETDESLAKKAEIVKKLVDEDNLDFSEACDHPSVYIGSVDARFIYSKYILKSFPGTYEDYLLLRMKKSLPEKIKNAFIEFADKN